MLKKFMSVPTRMCIHCRNRFAQSDLYRLQYLQDSLYFTKKIVSYSGQGRSFYLCKECVLDKKVSLSLCRVCKVDKRQKDHIHQSLKEAICQHNKKLESVKLPKK